ncbi:MAG: hypothetical protein OQK23_01830, partial [Rhodospirillales bacterium]|nr:hypothetical protein [Rhodospirillales bacterium]
DIEDGDLACVAKVAILDARKGETGKGSIFLGGDGQKSVWCSGGGGKALLEETTARVPDYAPVEGNDSVEIVGPEWPEGVT